MISTVVALWAMRLAHGWRLNPGQASPAALVREYIRPAVRAVPPALARRLGACEIRLMPEVEAGVASRWIERETGIEIALSTAGYEDHDIAMELLVCLGQALWERLTDAELRAFLKLLEAEISGGIDGEIDEQSLDEKRALLATRAQSRARKAFLSYARAAVAATAAEYVHSLWHDVTVRTGAEYLPAPQLRRRLEMMARWFPPGQGQRLFAGE